MSKTLGLRPFERTSLRLDDPHWINFVLCGGDGEGDEEDPEAGGDDDGDDPDGDDPDPKDKASKDRNPQARRAAEEAKATRLKLRDAERERDELRQFKTDQERAKLSETEQANAKLADAEARATALDEKTRALAIKVAFLTSNEVSWRNPATALKLIDLSEVKVENGEVSNPDALTAAIKALATSDAYLVADAPEDEDKDKAKPPAKRSSGEPPKDKNKADALDKATLARKYPGLLTH